MNLSKKFWITITIKTQSKETSGGMNPINKLTGIRTSKTKKRQLIITGLLETNSKMEQLILIIYQWTKDWPFTVYLSNLSSVTTMKNAHQFGKSELIRSTVLGKAKKVDLRRMQGKISLCWLKPCWLSSCALMLI